MMNGTMRKIASDTQAAKSFCIPEMKKLKIAELDRNKALKAFMRIVHKRKRDTGTNNIKNKKRKTAQQIQKRKRNS